MLHRTIVALPGNYSNHQKLFFHIGQTDPRETCSWTVMYLASGETALGNIVRRQDTLSPAGSRSLQQGGRLEKGWRKNYCCLFYEELIQQLYHFGYLGNFDAPVLFLGLMCGGIVVSGTVVIDQLPVSLCNTCLG